MSNPFKSADWSEKSLEETWKIIRDIAINEFKLDFYEPYFEVCTFEEMLQIYATSFPVMYNHWSFGKDYEELYRQYKYNRQSIAYEVIFNTNPALCYLLDTNTSVMQGLVMAHAAVGHSAFFKMNSLMRENTNAKTILPFMKNFRAFVEECEEKYDAKRVEQILDVCKSLSLYAIDKAEKIIFTKEQKEKRKLKRLEEQEKDFDILVENLDDKLGKADEIYRIKEENILKFIGKHSPNLKLWEREIISMYCKMQQYFYPQMLTKTMNEGFASFWHYQLMNRLTELGYLSSGDTLEFLHSHTSVLCQRDHDQPGYSGMNPYKMGYEIFNDIKRICLSPTKEDELFSPGLIGKNWVEEVNYAATNFRDSSFILQYLTPKLVRDFKFFKVKNDSSKDFYEISATQDDDDFKTIRKSLEEQYNLFGHIPYMYIEGASLKGNRTLYLNIEETKNQHVNFEGFQQTLFLIKKLWPYPIKFRYKCFDAKVYTETI